MEAMREDILRSKKKIRTITNCKDRKEFNEINFSKNEDFSLAVIENESSNIEGLTNQVRKYFYQRLSSFLRKNLKLSNKKSEKSIKKCVNEIARKMEYNILSTSKTVFEYKLIIAQKITDIEKCTMNNKLFEIFESEKQSCSKVIDDIHKKDNFTGKENISSNSDFISNCNKRASKKIKIRSDIIIPYKIEVYTKFTNNSPSVNTIVPSIEKKIEVLDIVECISKNNDYDDKNASDQTDERIYTDKENAKYSQYSESGMNKILQTRLCENIKKNEILNNNFHNADRSLNINNKNFTKQPVDTKTYRRILNVLKFVVTKFYPSPYIPDDICYKHIFQNILMDVLNKQIYDRGNVQVYAIEAIQTRKYYTTDHLLTMI